MAKIGSIGLSAQSIGTPRGRNPNAGDFGIQVASGLQSLMEDLELTLEDQKRLEEEQEAERKKRERFRAAAEFSRYQTQEQRRLMDAKNAASGDLSGFSEEFLTGAEERTNEFLAKISSELHDEYRTNVISFNNSLGLGAYEHELSGRQRYYAAETETASNNALKLLDARTEGAEEAIEAARQMILNSDLPEDAKNRQLQNFDTNVRLTVLGNLEKRRNELERDRARQEKSRRAGLISAGTKLARSMPDDPAFAKTHPVLARLMRVIASGEANGWNEMYRPEGSPRRTFDSYAQHPNAAVDITEGPHTGKVSTAAGLFQINFPTWKELKRLGFKAPDFSPESQLAAAIFLAEHELRADTGAAGILDVLLSGDIEQIGLIRKSLENRWPSLSRFSDEEFFFAIFDPGNGKDLLSATDANGTLQEKLAVMNSAFDEVAKQDVRAEEALEVENTKRINEFLSSVSEGEAGQKEIIQAAQEGWLNGSKLEEAQSLYKQELERISTLSEAVELLSDPTKVWESNAEHNRYLEALIDKQVMTAFANNETSAADHVLLLWDKTNGHTSGAVIQSLEKKVRSNVHEDFSFAMSVMDAMKTRNPDRFTKLVGKKLNEDLDFFQLRREYYSAQEMAESLNLYRDPNKAMLREQFLSQGKAAAAALSAEDIADHFDSFTLTDLWPWTTGSRTSPLVPFVPSTSFELGAEDQPQLPLDPLVEAELTRDYRRIFTDMYVKYLGDAEEAREAAIRSVARVWGPTSIGGVNSIVKFPIESTMYPRLRSNSNQPYKYVDDQIRTAFDLSENESYILLATRETEAGIARNARSGIDMDPDSPNFNPPPYQIMRVERSLDSKPDPLSTDAPSFSDNFIPTIRYQLIPITENIRGTDLPMNFAFSYPEELKRLESARLRMLNLEAAATTHSEAVEEDRKGIAPRLPLLREEARKELAAAEAAYQTWLDSLKGKF